PALAAALTILTVRAADPPEFDLSNSEMRPLIERFAADRGNLLRTYNVEASPARQARVKEFYTDWQGRIAKLNFDSMSQDGKVDYILFRNLLNHELRRMDLEASEDAKKAPYVPFSKTIVSLEEARRRMEPVNSKMTAETLTGLPKQIE